MKPRTMDDIAENSKKFILAGNVRENDYELMYRLAKNLSHIMHRSNSMPDTVFESFSDGGMTIGNGGFSVLVFTAHIHRSSSHYPGITGSELRTAICADFKKIVRSELFYYCINYTGDVDGRLVSLACYPRLDSSHTTRVSDLLQQCCEQILSEAKRRYGIEATVDISPVVVGRERISEAYAIVSDSIRFAEFWPEYSRPEINLIMTDRDDHFSKMTKLINKSDQFYALASKGDKEGAVAEALSAIEIVRGSLGASRESVLFDIRSFFDLVLQEFSRQSIPTIGDLGAGQFARQISAVRRMADLEKLVARIAEFFFESFRRYGNRSAAQRIRAVKEYIAENITDSQMTTTSLAKAFEISQPLLSAQFKKYAGDTVSGYVSMMRVEKAKELLEETYLPLPEVSVQSGFGSVATMHRVFKRYCGISPSQYRRGSNYKKKGLGAAEDMPGAEATEIQAAEELEIEE